MSLLRDARNVQIILLLAYSIMGKVYLDFKLSLLQLAITILFSVCLDMIFYYSKKKEWIFPKSAIISGFGIALMLRTDTIIPFLMASVLAIGLKYWLRYKGKHIFNPSNIGIVLVSVFFPITVATAPLQWGFDALLLVLMFLAGAVLAYQVSRLSLVISFLGGFLFVGIVRMIAFDQSFSYVFNDFMWGGLFVFTFNMITDPKTSPHVPKSQFLYGFLIAVFGQIMIFYEVDNALLNSLAIVCLGRFLWEWCKDKEFFLKNNPSLSK